MSFESFKSIMQPLKQVYAAENGSQVFNVLLHEDDDWLVYHAKDLFMVGCICPPVWLVLWAKGAVLLWQDWFGKVSDLPDQSIRFNMLNKYSSTSYLNAHQVVIEDIEDYNLTGACIQHIQPWIARTLTGGFIWLGLALLVYGICTSQ